METVRVIDNAPKPARGNIQTTNVVFTPEHVATLTGVREALRSREVSDAEKKQAFTALKTLALELGISTAALEDVIGMYNATCRQQRERLSCVKTRVSNGRFNRAVIRAAWRAASSESWELPRRPAAANAKKPAKKVETAFAPSKPKKIAHRPVLDGRLMPARLPQELVGKGVMVVVFADGVPAMFFPVKTEAEALRTAKVATALLPAR